VSAAPVKAPAPWPVGTWQAQLEPGAMKLTINEAGEARGSLEYQGGPVDVSGLYEPEPGALRLKLASRTFYGTLVCTQKGETWVGQLRATPQADAQVKVDAEPFGQKWDVTLERFF